MGYLILSYENGTQEILGDEQQYRKDRALSYRDINERFISDSDIDDNDDILNERK